MSDIMKIVIRGESKFENAREIYKDRMVLEEAVVSYEYHPLFKTARNPVRKWVSESADQRLLAAVWEMMPEILGISGMERRPDMPSLEFEVHYANGERAKKQLWPTGDDLAEVKKILTELVPAGEELPEMLKNPEEEDW